jgi:hypothetical protein
MCGLLARWKLASGRGDVQGGGGGGGEVEEREEYRQQ